MTIWKWADWLTPVSVDAQTTLGEGETPIVRSKRIGPDAGIPNLYFKLESTNPTGSFKDRFAAAAVSHMRAAGVQHCVATSSGNTGASLAAYCAAARIACDIAIVETAPTSKLAQMMCYGANIFRVRKFGLDAEVTANTFAKLQVLGRRPKSSLQISGYVYCPQGMSGIESISFELHEQIASIDHVFAPAGGGGLCVGVARGYQTLIREGQCQLGPAVHCVQPTGNNTIAGPLRQGKHEAVDVKCTTQISGLQVANVVDGHLAIEACRASGGTGHVVEDAATWRAQQDLAQKEGIFSEPAAAIALAAALQAVDAGTVDRQSAIVCLVTGSGFKDERSLQRMLDGAECPTIDLDEFGGTKPNALHRDANDGAGHRAPLGEY
jgi:threonine synthase